MPKVTVRKQNESFSVYIQGISKLTVPKYKLIDQTILIFKGVLSYNSQNKVTAYETQVTLDYLTENKLAIF